MEDIASGKVYVSLEVDGALDLNAWIAFRIIGNVFVDRGEGIAINGLKVAFEDDSFLAFVIGREERVGHVEPEEGEGLEGLISQWF